MGGRLTEASSSQKRTPNLAEPIIQLHAQSRQRSVNSQWLSQREPSIFDPLGPSRKIDVL